MEIVEFSNTVLVFISIFVTLELKIGNVFGFGKQPLNEDSEESYMWMKDNYDD